MLEMCASRIRIPQTPDNLYTSRPCEYIYRGTYRSHNHDPKTSKHLLETHPAKLYARSCSNTTTRAQHCLGLSHFLAKKTRSSPLPRMKCEQILEDERRSTKAIDRGYPNISATYSTMILKRAKKLKPNRTDMNIPAVMSSPTVHGK